MLTRGSVLAFSAVCDQLAGCRSLFYQLSFLTESDHLYEILDLKLCLSCWNWVALLGSSSILRAIWLHRQIILIEDPYLKHHSDTEANSPGGGKLLPSHRHVVGERERRWQQMFKFSTYSGCCTDLIWMAIWFDFFFFKLATFSTTEWCFLPPFLGRESCVLPESSCHLTQSVLCSSVGWVLKGELCWFLHIRRLGSDFNLPRLLGLNDQLQSEILEACLTSFLLRSGSGICVEGGRDMLFWHLGML